MTQTALCGTSREPQRIGSPVVPGKLLFDEGGHRLYLGDCLAVMSQLEGLDADAIVTDPPYGQTSLDWDVPVDGWIELAGRVLRPNASIWIFGTLRSLVPLIPRFLSAGWRLAQDVVWEKHNGSNGARDRFRRVHEQAVHLYRGRWREIYNVPPTTADATARTVRRKRRPPHWGDIGDSHYESHDGGPRIMRSVINARSCHGYAVHETQKPVEIVRPLVEHSVPPGGLVVDPFAGSGTTMLAAREIGRRSIGIELRARAARHAVRRLVSE